MSEKELIILRGLPGSGKSTLAKKLVGNRGIIHSTDEFHYINGEYKFQYEKLGKFHLLNIRSCINSMKKGISPIIIDNTNINARLCERYVAAAKCFGYKVVFKEPDTPWKFDIGELFRRNIHNTPKEVIERMLTCYEKTETVKRKLKLLLKYEYEYDEEK